MRCPTCRDEIPSRLLWRGTGFTCPVCETALRWTGNSRALAGFFAWLAGAAANLALKAAGTGWWMPLVGTLCAAFLGGAVAILTVVRVEVDASVSVTGR